MYKEGWLEKQGSKVKTWKKRWFVLHRPAGPGASYVLKYYTAENKTVEKVTLQLSACCEWSNSVIDMYFVQGLFKIPAGSSVSALGDGHRGEKKKHQNYFEISAEGNKDKTSLLLSADSPEDKVAWVEAIQRCIDSY